MAYLMLLHCSDAYARIASYDHTSGELTEYDRSMAEGLAGEPLRGHYSFLKHSGALVVFYRHEADLWLRIADRSWRIDSNAVVTWERRGEDAALRVSDGSDIASEVVYRPGPWSDPPLSRDPTPFVEAEDWDFGLFVSNVLSTRGRRDRIYSD